MQAFFGSQIAGQFSQFSRVWWVILQADANYRMKPSDFDKVFVRSKSGAKVPLSGLIDDAIRGLPQARTRFNGFPAVRVTGSQAPGYSSGQALERDGGNRARAAGRLLLRVVRTALQRKNRAARRAPRSCSA